MKMINSKFLILLLLLLIFTKGNSQDASSQADQLFEQLLTEHGVVGASAALAIDGEITWQNAKGYSNLANKTPFTDSSLTRIASIAKPMTAIAIMQLVEQGLIDLDQPIQTYLPTYPQPSQNPITVKHLLSHTSGIKGYKSSKEAQNNVEYSTLEAAMQVFQDRDLSFEPGSDFGYTSYGYVVLGAIIEKISGLSYADYMQKNIWDKADMRNTGIEKIGESYPNKSGLYHAKKGKAKLEKPNNLSNRTPGGGFYSTTNDLIKFGNAVINHTLIQEATFASMIKISFPDKEGNPYSYGWFLYGPTPNENAVIGHGGGQTGANTQIFINPTRRTVAVVLANTSGTGNNVIKMAVSLIEMGNIK